MDSYLFLYTLQNHCTELNYFYRIVSHIAGYRLKTFPLKVKKRKVTAVETASQYCYSTCRGYREEYPPHEELKFMSGGL
jgi:hypothetical protein